MDIRFRHPFTCCVCGPTRSGKTEWVKRLVTNVNSLVCPEPVKILWCYKEYQPSYDDLAYVPNLELIEGLPDWHTLKQSINVPKLIIFDDFMCELSKKEDLTKLFTRGAHHWNCSLIHILQNAFYNNMRTARINTHYLVLLRSVSDKLQVQTLARQLFPENPKYFKESFDDATSCPYGYLVVDLSPESNDEVRLRTCIFPGEICYAYVPMTI